MRLAATALLIFHVCQVSAAIDETADELPTWILPGIAMRESSSYYLDGYLVYVNRKIGAAGERGPFQETQAAFAETDRVGDFWRLSASPNFAISRAERRLRFLRQRLGSWSLAVSAWHVGVRGLRIHPKEAADYLSAVMKAGGLL